MTFAPSPRLVPEIGLCHDESPSGHRRQHRPPARIALSPADQLVWFWESQPNLEQAPFSAADFLDYQAQNQSFQQVATIRRLSFNLTGQGAAERIPGMVATPNVFSLVGVHPILGRDFLPEEGAFGAPRRVLLTALANSALGSLK